MKQLSDVLRKRLSDQHRGKNMIGSIAVNTVKTFFNIPEAEEHIIREKPILEGYVKFNKLFLKTSNQQLKIEIFKKKADLLQEINSSLTKLGYKVKIQDVYFK